MAAAMSPESKAKEFLATAHLYHLGRLPTESSHPQTKNLSDLAKNDVSQAVRLLQGIDAQALMLMQKHVAELSPLALAVRETLDAGHRVFICGCGATGRLAMSLEVLWRTLHPKDAERVVAFMAGGDVALVHSLEGFEDFPDYGAEQLQQLGFKEGDLLISSSEGGETPFVIGATEAALPLSSRKPFFLYCNPREILIEHVERSRRVLQNPRVHNICLFVGPMALAGSTRMQASTVLQLAIGLALFHRGSVAEINNRIGGWMDHYKDLPADRLAEFVIAESNAYKADDKVLYSVNDLAITVFTDTTERSPTFSLPPFNNQVMPREDHSWAYIMIPSTKTGIESWRRLLLRDPRVLNWPQRNKKTTMEYLKGFDFSEQAEKYRLSVHPESQHLKFMIGLHEGEIEWNFRNLNWRIPRSGKGLLFDHLLVKMLLNIHSTLLMGRMGRFESNFMTYVLPTNGKLVDRASRYVKWLLSNRGAPVPPDEVVVTELFRRLENLGDQESVVIKTADALSR